jgi:inorganic pyrophosphatase
MSKTSLLLVLASLTAVQAGCSQANAVPSDVTYLSDFALQGSKNFLTGFPTTNADLTTNIAVEIPTGTSQKWETCTAASLLDPVAFPGCTKGGKEMVHEVKKGVRRVLQHIGYPGNYGSIPMTSAADGDPLDIVAIGPALDRGTVHAVKVVGVIRCMDGTAQDDKVIAITSGSPLYPLVNTLADLDLKAPKAKEMLQTWYENYKGIGAMTCTAIDDEIVAAGLVQTAHAAAVAAGAAYP